jgi:hypothetical protein
MSGSVSMIDGHIDPDRNGMTDKESYPPLQYVDEDYNHIEITSRPTDKEIIKALEDFVKEQKAGYITVLEFGDKRDVSLEKELDLLASVFDLINRQQAEIERLTINMNAFGLGMKQEKERADTIRAEAIKEFAEKLERIKRPRSLMFESDYMFTVTMMEIDNLVKEMVGENK